MKIAYLINHNIQKNDGVTKKVYDQVQEWRSSSNEVKVYALTDKGLGTDSMLDSLIYEKKNFIHARIFKNKKLLNDIKTYKPDLVYFRFDTWGRTLNEIISSYKSIAELNSFDANETLVIFKYHKSVKNFLALLAYRLTRGFVLSKVSAYIAVTKEIARHKSNLIYHKPNLCLTNGINLDEYHIIKPTKHLVKRKGFFFIGTPNQPWQATDLIKQIANRLPQYDFHIVGEIGVSSDNIFFYGYLSKEEYLEILKKCQICIGTLGMHLLQMSEASPLKIREYLAYGYPVIIGCDDSAFPNALPKFIKKIDLKENLSELQLNVIKDFMRDFGDFIVPHADLDSINIRFIEKKRLNFFKLITTK
jgi:hypothetical protein